MSNGILFRLVSSAACLYQSLSKNDQGSDFLLYLLNVHPLLQLYVPDEDKSIFGRSVNKQVFEGLTTGLLQTVATILGSLWPLISESGQGEKTRISSPDAKVKSSATESFNTRTQDLIRYFLHSSHTASPPPSWQPFSSSHDLFTRFSTSLLHSSSLGLELVNLWFPQQRAICKDRADKMSELLEVIQLVSC